ncbi:hypothetical protein Vretifemale_21089 [Volvox reticuliferus]|uniref:CID domain-containing protein n=2 Tax=Volvox reticuliferus TaxID=1737510 RepID=A0A8J4G078_9CHLO|nr:hypothetical protein Vretifemale_21089 [Volvox reticuliferus]
MSGGGMNVNRESLVQRLQSLNVSQQSIESTSKWSLFYIKDAKSVVNIWLEEFGRTTAERRIAFLYLANHILQEGRKKGREFADEFFRVLPKALASVSRSSDAKLRNSAKRLVDIWDERKVFGSSQVRVLKEHLNGTGGGGTPTKPSSSGGITAAEGAPGGGSGSGSNDMDRRKLAAVGSLADVLYEVANAAARSSEWQTKCLQIKANVSSIDASLPDVVAARTILATALECLKAESERRKKAVTYIRMHLSQQEDSLKRTEDAHAALVAQKVELDERHAALLKQEQEQQEREQREREREREREMDEARKQQELQQQQQQQQQQQLQQQQQHQVSMGGMGTDGPASFLGIPPGGLPGLPPMMPPPFPLPGMDPTVPPFGLPGMPPFPGALLGPGGPPGMNPLAALAGAPGMNPLGPLPPFLGPMPGMNLNMPHPAGMNPLGGGGGPPGGGMGQLPGGLPDLAGALSALSASGFGGSGGGDAGAAANGSQPPQQQMLQPQGSGLQQQSSGGAMPQGPGQLPQGAPPPGGLQHPHAGPGQPPVQPPQQGLGHPQPAAPPQHPPGGPGHQHTPGGPAGVGGPPPPPHSHPHVSAGPGASSLAAAGPGASGSATAVGPPPLDPAGIDQLAAALANNSDQTAMLLANAFASMSQEERDRLGANLGDMLGSGGGGPGQHPLQLPGHPHPPHPPLQPLQSQHFPLRHHHHHHPPHHPPPPQPVDHGMGGGFGGSPMGNGDGDAMDAPYDPEFPD